MTRFIAPLHENNSIDKRRESFGEVSSKMNLLVSHRAAAA
jgi:hypothetical protein